MTEPRTAAALRLLADGTLHYHDDVSGDVFAVRLAEIEQQAAAAERARLRALIAQEIDRLWAIAYKYDHQGEGSIGLLVDMTNAIGGLDSLQQALEDGPRT